MNSEFYLEIPKRKAEMPAIIVACIVCFIGWAFHFGFFDWQGGFIWLAVTLPLMFFVYFKKRGEYFVRVNAEGISWRQGILSKLVFIPWNYMQRVDYLVFEINFQIKESGQVVSFATSGLSEENTDALKQYISDIVGEIITKKEEEKQH